MCHKVLAPSSHQEVKSCKILNWVEYQQIRTVSIRSWAKTRFACSSGTRKWNPARPQLSKISTNQNYFNQVMSQEQICIKPWNQEVKYCKISIKQILHPIRTVSIRSSAKTWFTYWTQPLWNSCILHTSPAQDLFRNTMPVILVKIYA